MTADIKGRGCDFGFGFSPDLLVPPTGSALFEAEGKATAADIAGRGCDFGVSFRPDFFVSPAGSDVLEAEAAAVAGVGCPRTDEIGPLHGIFATL